MGVDHVDERLPGSKFLTLVEIKIEEEKQIPNKILEVEVLLSCLLFLWIVT